MAESTGSALYVEFDGTDISGNFREFKKSGEMGLVDASAGADTDVTYLTTLRDGTASLKALFQTGGDAVRSLLVEGAEGTLIVGPLGNTSGLVKYSRNAIIKKAEDTIPYKDVIEYSIDFQFSGTATEGTF